MELDLNLNQILLFLLLVPGLWCGMCVDERNLTDVLLHRIRNHLQIVAAAPSHTEEPDPVTCPVDLYRHQNLPEQANRRSLSPWRQIVHSDPNYFPSSYYVAECLCDGCIMFNDDHVPYESDSFNSKPVIQKQLFLKKEPCGGNGKKYRLKVETRNVAVGCTCVKPLSTSTN